MSNTVIKTLPLPWQVAGQQVTEVEIRPAVVEDLLEAENEGNPISNPNAYALALACRQMVRAGTFTGPFVIGQFKQMKPRNFYAIRAALQEADALGEDLPPAPGPAS